MQRVIFACVHSAGRSQMAAAWLNALSDPRQVRAASAGTQPAERVHPEAVTAMREVDIDISTATPQLLTAKLVADATHVITMGCGDACPVIPKWVKRADWPLEDPKGKDAESVRRIRDEIRARVERLIEREGWSMAR